MTVTSDVTWTVAMVLKWATDDFRARGIENPRLDAEVLLAHALSTSRTQLVIEMLRPLASDELGLFRTLVKRRRAREPVAYLVGGREFYGRTFHVDARVLVPRPDTETLVEVALARTRHVSMCARVLDLCTGSGCVAITLARERPTTQVVASDVSADAIVVASDNALRLGAYNVQLVVRDLFGDLGRFDLITANPPYVATEDVGALAPDIARFEPRLALDGGRGGLDVVTQIVSLAPTHLFAGGVLAVEVGHDQADRTAALFHQAGFENIERARDYARIERVVSGVWRGTG